MCGGSFRVLNALSKKVTLLINVVKTKSQILHMSAETDCAFHMVDNLVLRPISRKRVIFNGHCKIESQQRRAGLELLSNEIETQWKSQPSHFIYPILYCSCSLNIPILQTGLIAKSFAQ